MDGPTRITETESEWLGTLIGRTKQRLTVIFKFTFEPDFTLSGSFEVPDQSAPEPREGRFFGSYTDSGILQFVYERGDGRGQIIFAGSADGGIANAGFILLQGTLYRPGQAVRRNDIALFALTRPRYEEVVKFENGPWPPSNGNPTG